MKKRSGKACWCHLLLAAAHLLVLRVINLLTERAEQSWSPERLLMFWPDRRSNTFRSFSLLKVGQLPVVHNQSARLRAKVPQGYQNSAGRLNTGWSFKKKNKTNKNNTVNYDHMRISKQRVSVTLIISANWPHASRQTKTNHTPAAPLRTSQPFNRVIN